MWHMWVSLHRQFTTQTTYSYAYLSIFRWILASFTFFSFFFFACVLGIHVRIQISLHLRIKTTHVKITDIFTSSQVSLWWDFFSFFFLINYFERTRPQILVPTVLCIPTWLCPQMSCICFHNTRYIRL